MYKSGKTVTKSVAKKSAAKVASAGEGTVKAKKAKVRYDWTRVINVLFKQVAGNGMQMKLHCKRIISSIINDVIDRVGREACELCRCAKRRLMDGTSIQKALLLVFGKSEILALMNEDASKASRAYKDVLARKAAAHAAA